MDTIEYKLVAKIEGIFHMRQTCFISEEYLVKYKGYHHKETMWMKHAHLDHLLDMVTKFEHERGHKFGVKRT